jgi:hypothetical protein
VVNLE